MSIKTALRSISEFIRDSQFAKAYTIAIAVVLPLLVTYYLGDISIGIGMALGVFLCSPSDVPGSLRRRVLGILISIAIAFTASLSAGYAVKNVMLFLPLLAFFIFAFSMIAIYGFRASLISFSGLMGVVLSMVTLTPGTSILTHSLWILLGGVWYLAFSLFLHFLSPNRQSDSFLKETFSLTASYLRLRAALIGAPKPERKGLQEKLFNLQTDLNTNHETLRELVISRRKTSGRSSDARKKLLIFTELIDILELSMANPVNYEKMQQLFDPDDPSLEMLKHWTLLMALELEKIGETLPDGKKISLDPELETCAETLRNTNPMEQADSVEKLMILRGLYHFKEKQYQKIIAIERLLQDLEVDEQFLFKRREAVKFIPTQEFRLKTLQDHLDLKSPIFRHSLRLTLIVLIGYALGLFLELQNAYWILLTSIVIMRPGYGLTKKRSKERTAGTLIGGIIAAAIILLVDNAVVYGVLAVVTFIVAFSMLQKNYRTSAAFITLNIVFVYALIAPNAFDVIGYRVMDTLIGGGLAFLGNIFLWPSWEYRNIQLSIKESISANKTYLQQVQQWYEKPNLHSAAYKLSRKEAFLAMGNLSAAFQRMTQDPKSKQKDIGEFYKITSLNQELLFSAASLGSFIRTHHTTEASVHFAILISEVQAELQRCVKLLEGNPIAEKTDPEKLEEAKQYFQDLLAGLLQERKQELARGKLKGSTLQKKIQEAQLLLEQLKWMLEISGNLRELLSSLYLKDLQKNIKPPF